MHLKTEVNVFGETIEYTDSMKTAINTEKMMHQKLMLEPDEHGKQRKALSHGGEITTVIGFYL